MQEVAYDPRSGQVARRSVPVSEGTDESKMLFDAFAYDALGREVRHTSAWNAITDTDYDGLLAKARVSIGPTSDAAAFGVASPPTDVDTTGSWFAPDPSLPIVELPHATGPGSEDPFGIKPPALAVGYDRPLSLLEQFLSGEQSGRRTTFMLPFEPGFFRDLGIALAADDLQVVTLRPQITEFLPPSLREAALGRMAGVGIPLIAAILTPGPQDDLALAAGTAGGSVARGATRFTSGSQVTEQVIREAMKDASLASQQAGGVSLPIVQKYVDKLLAGEVAPAIKVDGRMIVDGNHRYIAGRILGQEPAIQPWAGGRPNSAIPWNRIPIDPKAWP